jgi:hypothetical protein
MFRTMKKFYFLVLSSLLFLYSFAAPKDEAIKNNGTWASSTTWSLARKPITGDTVVVPYGTTLIINSNENNQTLYIKVYGTLKFAGGKLKLSSSSTVIVYATGTIINTGNAEINIGNQEIYEDGDPVVVGPVMANTSTNGFVPFNPLPIKFVGFTVTCKNNTALIQWSTSEEINANTYEVERSADGSNWTTIAYVAAIGNSSALSNYSFTDKNLSAKIIYYRIKEVDLDGKTTLTAIKSIRTDVTSIASDIKIASIQNKVLVQFPQEIKGSVVVRFVSMNGQLVDQQTINNPVGQIVLDSKVTGTHVISISNGQDINTAKQVIL